jgi:hypothetical protein
MRNRVIALLTLGLVAAACSSGGGSNPRPTAAPQQNQIDVKMQEFAFVPSGTAHTGALTLNYTNTGKQAHMAVIGRLDQGKTLQDVLQELKKNNQGGPPPWFHDAPADDPLVTPGQSSGVTIHASQPGTYVMLCFVTDPKSHKPHALLGMVGSFDVEKSATAAPAPKATATFTATKSALKTQDLSAGLNVIDVEGATEPSQFIVARFEKGKTLKDLNAWFNSGGAGTPPGIDILGGTSIAKGATGVVSYNLQPGTYTAILGPTGKGTPLTATFKVT